MCRQLDTPMPRETIAVPFFQKHDSMETSRRVPRGRYDPRTQRQMKQLRSITLLLAALVCCLCGGAIADTVPQHPEMDNPEYRLDVVTNGYSRWWREVWDAGDNRFRFRLGSNNVTQWFIDEQLKLATDLIPDRLRFRFYHMRIKPYSTEDIGTNVLEFEGRVWRRNYLSLYARPTSDKREGSLGLMLQNRKAVNRFVKLSVEWPGVMRNFFEHYRNTPDSLLNIFIDRPVRFGLDVRAEITSGVWIRALGEYTPDFVMGEEVTATGEQIPKERAEAKALSGWVEYVTDPSRELREQTALGIEYSYQRSRNQRTPSAAVRSGMMRLSLLHPRRRTGPVVRHLPQHAVPRPMSATCGMCRPLNLDVICTSEPMRIRLRRGGTRGGFLHRMRGLC